MAAKETDKARRERARTVAERLAEAWPDAVCELTHRNAFELLCATVLSAQCTDKRVNSITPELFRRWPTPEALAAADPEALKDVIKSTGFFNNKAKSLLGLSAQIRDRHAGRVPETLEELVALPGVARKTANVVMGTAYGVASGVVVDTHVQRLCHKRLLLTAADDPVKLEAELMAALPRTEWIDFSHRMIWHGRRVCDARRPACGRCNLADLCPSAALG